MDSMIDTPSLGWKPLTETQVIRQTNRSWFPARIIKRSQKVSHPLPLSPSSYLKRTCRDIEQLSVSIASGVDSAEKWKEFCTNGGGVSSLLQCIHSAAEDLGLEYDKGVDFYSVDGSMQRREEAFIMVGSTCRVLRNLCARDSNWAAMVTDDVLNADEKEPLKVKEHTHKRIISDLVKILNYANEADSFIVGMVVERRGEK